LSIVQFLFLNFVAKTIGEQEASQDSTGRDFASQVDQERGQRRRREAKGASLEERDRGKAQRVVWHETTGLHEIRRARVGSQTK
jgi:hypothetical protein